MKNTTLIAAILTLLTTASIIASGANLSMINTEANVSTFEGLFAPFGENANMAIRRNRDGRVITSPGAAFPNDRVSRGESYTLEVAYTTDSVDAASNQPAGPTNYAVKVVMKVGGNAVDTKYFNNQSRRSTTFKWGGNVSTDPNADNITFEAYNNRGARLDRVRLPIGRY